MILLRYLCLLIFLRRFLINEPMHILGRPEGRFLPVTGLAASARYDIDPIYRQKEWPVAMPDRARGPQKAQEKS